MDDSFRLLTFNTYDDVKQNDTTDNADRMGIDKTTKEFTIQMFGINEKGKTASIFVEGYNPFFYAKVGDDWSEAIKCDFIEQLRGDLGQYHEDAVVSAKLVKQKKLYGFDAGKLHTFVLIKFINETSMKKAKNLWYTSSTCKKTNVYSKQLKPNGYMFGKYGTILYEAQIPPLLRLFHIKEISPSGWITLPRSKTLKHKKHSTTCDYEFTINYKHIIPLPKKETIVPYKICSFDIEASSSHGDFPLAVKNYKKLATNIVDLCDDVETNCTEEFIKNIIMTAFEYNERPITDVDIVYPIHSITQEMLESLFVRWIKICPATYKKNDMMEDSDDIIDIASEDENDADADAESNIEAGAHSNELACSEETLGFNWKNFKPKVKSYKKKGSIIDLLLDKDEVRETKILELTKTLTASFPKLKGDNVTFIGSTFVRYGEAKPYLNHCIARDTCDDLPQIENSKIESYKTEKEVLLAWTKLIQKENPDVIIGYNIFGFDYQFMFLRAKELGCEHKFLELSRNKNEVCINRDWRTKKEGLEESKIVLASGEYDLRIIKMTGRLQVDLLNYFRREYQLNQYKLDYVAGYFIGDAVTKLQHTADGNTKIYSKNLTGLENGSFISFEEEAHSIDYYKEGKKFEGI